MQSKKSGYLVYRFKRNNSPNEVKSLPGNNTGDTKKKM